MKLQKLVSQTTKKEWMKAIRLACVVSTFAVSAMAETIAFPMGTAGEVTLEYQATSTSKGGYLRDLYDSAVAGSASNHTAFPVACSFTTTGTPFVWIKEISIAPGASKAFQENLIDISDNLNAAALNFKADCHVNLLYTFSNRHIEQRFPGGSLSAVIGKNEIDFTLSNDSDQPIEIVWNESSLVGADRVAGRIFHQGIKYADREQNLPNTTVPPGAKVEDLAAPTKNVFYVDGWDSEPLLPSMASIENADAKMKEMRGRKIVLFLQLLVGGRKVALTLPFEVASVFPA